MGQNNWGINNDESFVINPLTDIFIEKLANIRQTDNFILFVNYTKGNETEINLQFKFKLRGINLVCQDSIVNYQTGFVEPFTYKFNVSGKYRISVPVLPSEDSVYISVKKIGGLSGIGSIILIFETANLKSK